MCQLDVRTIYSRSIWKSTKLLEEQFQDWYAEQVAKFLKKNKKLYKFEIDLRLNVIKPIHARWLLKAVKQLLLKTDHIKSAFEAAGIV